jgi:uncharacterized Zn-finger protein
LHVNAHPELGLIPCPHCPKAFLSRPALTSHVKITHENVVHECHLCDAKFKRSYQLLDHLGEHEGKPRNVCVCGKKFYREPTYFDHRRVCKVFAKR